MKRGEAERSLRWFPVNVTHPTPLILPKIFEGTRFANKYISNLTKNCAECNESIL